METVRLVVEAQKNRGFPFRHYLEKRSPQLAVRSEEIRKSSLCAKAVCNIPAEPAQFKQEFCSGKCRAA